MISELPDGDRVPAPPLRLGTARAPLGLALTLVAVACAPARVSPPAPAAPPAPLEVQLAEALTTACPAAAPGDAAARDACAGRLARLPLLRDRMGEPFLWGTQAAARSFTFTDGKTTRFNPLAWRKMYLSLEMFAGGFHVEHVGQRTILHMATRFRNALDPGEYPYPFWHSTAKWESYQFSVETMFVLEGDKIVGALRSAEQDHSRPSVAHTFDGDWNIGPKEETDHRPIVLFQRLFSPTNPYVASLDRAFRAFEAESRPYNCAGCHRPDNLARQGQLEMFCYPNQALASRHAIVRAIEERRMPPGTEAGIADETERARLVAAARSFEAAADAALATERALQER